MNRMAIWTTMLWALVGCTSVRVYDVPKVQDNLSQALQRNDEVSEKAQNDYVDKKTLVDNLARSGSSTFRAAEPELRGQLTHMHDLLDLMSEQRKKMLSANSDIASLGYGHNRLNSDDPQADKFEAAIQNFQASADASNRTLAEYSRLSNALTDTITAKKLYVTFESTEFFERLQRSVRAAQDNSENMQEEIDRDQKLLDHGIAKKASRAAMESSLTTMKKQAQAYVEKGQRLSQISHDMRDVTADARVTSLDAPWPQVQKLLSQMDQMSKDLENTNHAFEQAAVAFRKASKR